MTSLKKYVRKIPLCFAITVFVLSGILAMLLSGVHNSAMAEKCDKIVYSKLVVYKEKRILEAWSYGRKIKTFKISLGRGGAGPKVYEGDLHTPEGKYTINERHKSKRYHLFMHISYPGPKDVKRYRKAKRDKRISSKASIGGAVGIHGVRKRFGWLPHKLINWTAGCIAVDNDEIEELYAKTKHNAQIIIKP